MLIQIYTFSPNHKKMYLQQMKTQTDTKILLLKSLIIQIATGGKISLTELEAHAKKGENIKLPEEIEKYTDIENIQKKTDEYFVNISSENYKIIIQKTQLLISRLDLKSKKIQAEYLLQCIENLSQNILFHQGIRQYKIADQKPNILKPDAVKYNRKEIPLDDFLI